MATRNSKKGSTAVRGGKVAAPAAKQRAARASKPAAVAPASAPATRSDSPAITITHEMIAKRAYQIWQSGRGGSEKQNWAQAERELRGGR